MRARNDAHEAVYWVTSQCLLRKLLNLHFCNHVYALVYDLFMDKDLEQKVNVKLCAKLEKSAIVHASVSIRQRGNESYAMFRLIWALQKRKKCPWKTISALEDLPQASSVEMWRKLMILCMKIVSEDNPWFCQCSWSVVWFRVGNPNAWIWTCSVCIPSLSLICWSPSRNSITSKAGKISDSILLMTPSKETFLQKCLLF